MNSPNTYQAVRIGDVADWRLICEISSRGMSAYLKHIDPMQEVVTLFEEHWDNGDNLLKQIENAVYDQPQVLDDFSADIAVVAPRSIWVPASEVDDDDERAAELYNQVYEAAESDIMTETAGNATCLYCLVPGLKGFLQRTFPGARIHSHLAVMAERFRERIADMPRVYAEIREGEVDILAFEGKKMLTAATHQWRHTNDIQYHIFNIINVYGLDPGEIQLSLSGLKDVKTELMPQLRNHIAYVMHTMMPSMTGAQLPTSAALMARS